MFRICCGPNGVTWNCTDRPGTAQTETNPMTIPALTKLNRTLLALLIAVAANAAVAQEDPHQSAPQEQRRGQPQQQRSGAPEQGVLRLLPPDAVSRHTVDTPDGKLD